MTHKSPQQQFGEEGYLIYRGLFAGGELQRLLDACNRVLDQYIQVWDREHPNQDFEAMRHLNDPRWHRDGLEGFKTIMEAATDPRCLEPVEQVFARPSLFRCTSYFINPRFTSREGNWHRDSQFLCTTAEKEQAMLQRAREQSMVEFGLQFQVPLVDSSDIELVPHSAGRDDTPAEHHIRRADNFTHNSESGMPNALRVDLKAGDGVIFNQLGLHRGRYHVDKPRRTLMLTYTPLDSPRRDFFSDQPWCEEPGHLDCLSPRAQAYFRQFIEVFHPFWAEQKAARKVETKDRVNPYA